MCTTCGCGKGETRIEGDAPHAHEHRHADGTVHSHAHAHAGEHAHEHPAGEAAARLHAAAHSHLHRHADGSEHEHWHEHEGAPDHDHLHEEGEHWHADGTVHTHDPAAGAVREGQDPLHFGAGPAGTHAPGMSQARMVQIEQDILAKNDGYAAKNREWLGDRGIFAVNLVSSPGSGKTALLVKSI